MSRRSWPQTVAVDQPQQALVPQRLAPYLAGRLDQRIRLVWPKVIPSSATNMRTFVGRPAFVHSWEPYCSRGLARALPAFIRNSSQ
jgi:hypothetical protein